MHLTPNDFYINEELTLGNKLPGYSFIFFMTLDCPYCDDVKPAFDHLAKIIQGCSFFYMDVSQKNQEIVIKARQSRTPIDYVPYLMLFYNGKQIKQYIPDEDRPQNNVEKMTNFLIQHASTPPQSPLTDPLRGGEARPTTDNIPPYSIGIPGNLASKKVCYLSYPNAYTSYTKNKTE